MTRPTPASLLPIDVEIVRMATRFTAVRPMHLVAWTGASPWTVRAGLRRLTDSGLIRTAPVILHLRDATGQVRAMSTTVYVATSAGAKAAGSWTVAGYDDLVSLSAPRPSAATADHTSAVADLACWYRRSGFEIVAEREIVSMERPTKLGRGRPPAVAWTTAISPIGGGVHPPDLVACAADGTPWAVELERARKPVATYKEVIGAYHQIGRGQVWHVGSAATGKRIHDACAQLGIPLAPRAGMYLSPDGLVRMQLWTPAPSAGGGPETWGARRWVPAQAPAGLPTPAVRPDLTASWKLGAIVDPESVSEPTESSWVSTAA